LGSLYLGIFIGIPILYFGFFLQRILYWDPCMQELSLRLLYKRSFVWTPVRKGMLIRSSQEMILHWDSYTTDPFWNSYIKEYPFDNSGEMTFNLASYGKDALW